MCCENEKIIFLWSERVGKITPCFLTFHPIFTACYIATLYSSLMSRTTTPRFYDVNAKEQSRECERGKASKLVKQDSLPICNLNLILAVTKKKKNFYLWEIFFLWRKFRTSAVSIFLFWLWAKRESSRVGNIKTSGKTFGFFFCEIEYQKKKTLPNWFLTAMNHSPFI